MKTWNKPIIIDECLSQIETDFMPFHDAFRSIYGFNILKPNNRQLHNTFELISFLMKDKDIIAVFGPEMKPSGNSNEIDLERIKKTFENQPYDNNNYVIWFDFAGNWDK